MKAPVMKRLLPLALALCHARSFTSRLPRQNEDVRETI